MVNCLGLWIKLAITWDFSLPHLQAQFSQVPLPGAVTPLNDPGKIGPHNILSLSEEGARDAVFPWGFVRRQLKVTGERKDFLQWNIGIIVRAPVILFNICFYVYCPRYLQQPMSEDEITSFRNRISMIKITVHNREPPLRTAGTKPQSNARALSY